MDDKKAVYTIGDWKKPKRVPREKPEEHSADSDTNINTALDEMYKEPEDDDVIMGECYKADLEVRSV